MLHSLNHKGLHLHPNLFLGSLITVHLFSENHHALGLRCLLEGPFFSQKLLCGASEGPQGCRSSNVLWDGA